MIRIIADNIISPLGATTEENLAAVRKQESALKEHRHKGMPEPFVASLFDEHLPFEEGLIRSIEASVSEAAAKGCCIDPSSGDVVFIISSTKGNVHMLEQAYDASGDACMVPDDERMGYSAQKVAGHFGNGNVPVVVSNACISGLSAMITAGRLIGSGRYATAIVAGYDVQSKFIVSGFQSFKAMSPDPCRPFDGDRCGLNLGEAVASVIMTSRKDCNSGWVMAAGAVNNDASHISNPSRTAEGSVRAIQEVMQQTGTRAEDITCISAHGTATLYNDEMEAVALDRTGLAQVPVFSLKGYYGHTMGAAGLLESIITLHAVDEGWIPATRGFAEEGTSRKINVCGNETEILGDGKHRKTVLKLLSGFGGCNAAVIFKRDEPDMTSNETRSGICEKNREEPVLRKERTFALDSREGVNLTALYKERIGNYPKFYKMDPLCKLGFVVTEMLLEQESAETGRERFTECEDRAVVICTRNGSLADDISYVETIADEKEYYPSPAVFVYTLSNIVTGEIALRNKYFGETSCFVMDRKDPSAIEMAVATAFADKRIKSVVGGWLDYDSDGNFEAEVSVWEIEN